jgi:hypothetical protein
MMSDLYKIVRFKFQNPSRVVARGLTLKEAQEHCRRNDTHKYDKKGDLLWFDGYTRDE